MGYQDVFNAGTGMAERRVVTWCKSALTGQDVGRWRSIRSLYCLTWVATLKSVRIRVAGWAVANAHPDVLRAADRTCPANDDDGVASVLEAMVASVSGS